MNELPILLLAILAILVCLAAFFLVLDIFFPVRIGRVQALVEQSPGRSFLVGLVNALFVSVLLLVLNSFYEQSGASIFQLLIVVLLGAGVICIIFGLAGIVHRVGMRLRPRLLCAGAGGLGQHRVGAGLCAALPGLVCPAAVCLRAGSGVGRA